MNVDAYSLKDAWLETLTALIDMMKDGEVDPRMETLPEGISSGSGVEYYARTVCEANPRSDLGVIYALASVATCIATQGGFVVQCPIAGGGWLEIPGIQHFIGVAPSGWRKSSALAVAQKPLERALAAGEHARRERVMELVVEMKTQVVRDNRGDPEFILDDKQFSEVFNAGLCMSTLVKDPTVEALRNIAVLNGGCVAALAGEADVFRNVSAYSKNGDAGSLTFFLDLWDQASISTARVGAGMMHMPEAALWLGVLFQTDVFAEVTSGGGGRGGTGADSFMSRGMFGRIWVVETSATGGFAAIAADYGDDVIHTHDGPEGIADSDGMITPLGLALLDYEHQLTELVQQTNDYRMSKALDHAWKAASTKHGADLQVPEAVAEPREALRLSHSAQRGYNRLQRLYNALEEALAGMDEDAQSMWGPLVSRYVQHVMREALIVTLSSGSREITEETIEDCATRIVPWRVALHTKALVRRTDDRMQDLVASSAMDNPRAEDRTPAGRIRTLMGKMAREMPDKASDGWGKRDITRKFESTLPRQGKKGAAKLVADALEKLCKDPDSGVAMVEGKPNPVSGLRTFRYTIEDWAWQYSS